MKLIITILTFCILFSCGHKETRIIISAYKNGNAEIIHYLPNKNDTLTYRKEVFYESGKINYTGNFSKGIKEGVWTWWYENGNKKDKCKYEKGFYVDTVYHWYENGNLKQVEIVAGRNVRSDGCCQCNGTIIRYYENGKLKEIFTSIKDKIQGKFTSYDEKGSWKVRTYKNDSLCGPTIEHFIDSDNIKTIVVGQYINNEETGLWKWYDKDSILILTAVYVNGILKGEYIRYFPNGKIKQKGIMEDGEFQGEVYYYDESEKLIKKEFYKKGKLIRTTKNNSRK